MNVLLQFQQVRGILERLPGGRNYLRNQTFLRVLVGSRVRIGELCPLRLGDVDWENQTIWVHSKGNREPEARYVNSDAFEDLGYYIEDSFGDTDTLSAVDQRYVFPSGDGKTPISPQFVSGMVRGLIRECKSISASERDHLTVHSFRQFYANTQLRSGLDDKTVSVLLGHRSPNTIEMWCKMSRDKLDLPDDTVSIRLAGVSERHFLLIHGKWRGNI